MCPPTKRQCWMALLGLAALLIGHVDAWRSSSWALDRSSLWMGVLPAELGYRLLWMLAAWIYLAWFCRVIWHERESSS